MATAAGYPPTERTTARRKPERASYDHAVVHAILDEALVAHLAVLLDGAPRVLPTTFARIDETVYVHGSLGAIVERAAPGRATAVRPPTEIELRTTLVLSVPLVEVSAKVRTGGPIDDEADMAWPVWAGVIPLRLSPGDPERA